MAFWQPGVSNATEWSRISADPVLRYENKDNDAHVIRAALLAHLRQVYPKPTGKAYTEMHLPWPRECHEQMYKGRSTTMYNVELYRGLLNGREPNRAWPFMFTFAAFVRSEDSYDTKQQWPQGERFAENAETTTFAMLRIRGKKDAELEESLAPDCRVTFKPNKHQRCQICDAMDEDLAQAYRSGERVPWIYEYWRRYNEDPKALGVPWPTWLRDSDVPRRPIDSSDLCRNLTDWDLARAVLKGTQNARSVMAEIRQKQIPFPCTAEACEIVDPDADPDEEEVTITPDPVDVVETVMEQVTNAVQEVIYDATPVEEAPDIVPPVGAFHQRLHEPDCVIRHFPRYDPRPYTQIPFFPDDYLANPERYTLYGNEWGHRNFAEPPPFYCYPSTRGTQEVERSFSEYPQRHWNRQAPYWDSLSEDDIRPDYEFKHTNFWDVD